MPIAVSCSACDKQVRVKDELAGKKIKCPECAAVLAVPAPNARPAASKSKGGAITDEKAPARSAKHAPPPDDDEDEDVPARKKAAGKSRKAGSKSGGSNTTLILALSGGGVLLIAAVVLTIVLWPKKSDDTNANASKPDKDKPGPVVPSGGPSPISGQPIAIGTGEAKTAVFQKLLRSVAFIVMKDSVGSGSLIDRDEMLVLTNYHVVSDEQTATIYFPAFDEKTRELRTDPQWYFDNPKESRPVQGKPVYRDSKRDLALVKLSYIPPGVPTVPLLPKSAKVADNVHSIGSSGIRDGALWRYTYGAVRQVYQKQIKYEKQMLDCWVLESNAPTNRGDSGGPIVNERGQLVAIVQGGVMVDPEDRERMVSWNVDVREVHYILGEYYKSIRKTYEPPKLSEIDLSDMVAVSKKLTDTDASIRLQAVRALSEFGTDARAMVPALIRAWKDDDPNVRHQIAKALELIGPPTSQDAAVLLELVESTVPEAKRYAAEMLGKQGLVKKDQALPALIALSKTTDLETRLKAVASMGAVAASEKADVKKPVAAALVERLTDEDKAVRAGAAAGLGRLGADVKAEALPKLIETLGDSDTTVAQAASNAVQALGDPTDRDLPLLMKALQSKKAIERAVALELLVKLGPKAKDALPQIQPNLKDSDMRVRLAAIALAGALGKEGRSVAATLGEMLGEPIKQEDVGDAKLPAETVGDAHMRATLLRSVCMVMWGAQEGNTNVVMMPMSGFVVHLGERLVLTPYTGVKDQKFVTVFFPAAPAGNLITNARDYITNANSYGIPAQVVATNPKTQLALVKLARLPPGTEALPLAAKAPDKGVKVATLCADDIDLNTLVGKLWQMHSAKVLDVRPHKSKEVEGFFVLMDGVFSEYDLGYPVMDEQGYVVAVGLESARIKLPDGKMVKLTVGVDVREVRPLIDEYFVKIRGSFREAENRASRGNWTQNNFRIAIAKALAQMGPDAVDATKALRNALKDTSAAVRAQVVVALCGVGSKAAIDSIPDIIQAATLEDDPALMEQSIAKLGKETVQPLIKLIKDNSPIKNKVAAIRTLGRIGPDAKDAMQVLTLCANTPDAELRPAAIDAIEKINKK